MIVAIVFPLVASVLLGVAGPTLARRAGPAAGARLLPVLALLVAAASLTSVAVIAGLLLAGNTWVARLGRWSVDTLPGHEFDLGWVGGVACAVLAGTAVTATVRHAVRLIRELTDAARLCRGGAVPGDVLTVQDRRPRAYAVGALGLGHGSIVITTGMLTVLNPQEQAAVLAHERAHLRHRHHVSLIAAELAARADPFLGPLLAATTQAVEREADEDAARSVGDRSVVARAVAHAGLATAAFGRAAATPAPLPMAVSTHVTERVDALVVPPVGANRPAVALLVGIAVATLAAVAFIGEGADHHLDHARDMYVAASGAVDPVG